MLHVKCFVCENTITGSTKILHNHLSRNHSKQSLVDAIVKDTLEKVKMKPPSKRDRNRKKKSTIYKISQTFAEEDTGEKREKVPIKINNELIENAESNIEIAEYNVKDVSLKQESILSIQSCIDVQVKEDPTDLLEVNNNKYINNSDTGLEKSASPLLHYCNTCGNGYLTHELLSEHIRIHMVKCHMCHVTFQYEEEYMAHVQSHVIKVFICHYCHREFADRPSLILHLDEHFDKEFYENILSMEEEYKVSVYNRNLFDSFSAFGNNYYYCQRPESLNKYSFCCDSCGITYYNFQDYQLHWRTHNNL